MVESNTLSILSGVITNGFEGVYEYRAVSPITNLNIFSKNQGFNMKDFNLLEGTI